MASPNKIRATFFFSTSVMARFTQFEFLRRIVCRIPQLHFKHPLQQHVLSLCLHNMAPQVCGRNRGLCAVFVFVAVLLFVPTLALLCR